MHKPNFSLIFLILLITPSLQNQNPEEDQTTIEELIAIDEQQQQQEHETHFISSTSTSTKVVSKAQKIVIEINNENANNVINKNEYVLLMGYTPWCPRSAELMPQFAKAATFINDEGLDVVMAKVDAERFPKIASEFEIKGFPTLILFNKGVSQGYTGGGFTAEDLVIWAKKKSGRPVERLSFVSEAEAFVNKYSMFAVGLFEKFEGPQYEEFVKAAIANNEIQFVETNSHEVAKFLFPDMKPAVVPFIGLVKNEPEKYTVFEEPLEMEKILQFLENNKFPLVTTLTELNSAKVYSTQIALQLYVFADSDEFKSLCEPLQEVAKKFKSKIMFIYVDIIEENLAKPFLSLLGLEESNKTVVAAFDNKISSKYLLESEPTPDKLEEFCSGLLLGTVSTHYRSQTIPDNENASVVAVVGKTLDDLVLSSSQNVVLEVYTPWCMSCEALTKKVEKLAKHFKGSENLIFARIDASVNEHPKLQVNDYPTLLFYPAADKSNPITLSTKSSLKDLAIFIKKNVNVEENAAKDEL